MGYKVFVSYKYGDKNVRAINKTRDYSLLNFTTTRDYVDILEEIIGKDNIYKGEHDEEDLSHLSENEIWEKLKDKIYDSSITIVLITPNMIDTSKTEANQWIPWEISYSLKQMTRNGRISKSNGIISVVIPDRNNSYSYVMSDFFGMEKDSLFPIIKNNMNNLKFNHKSDTYKDDSYIGIVKWDTFINNMDSYLKKAEQKSKNVDEYKLNTSISKDYSSTSIFWPK